MEEPAVLLHCGPTRNISLPEFCIALVVIGESKLFRQTRTALLANDMQGIFSRDNLNLPRMGVLPSVNSDITVKCEAQVVVFRHDDVFIDR